MIRKGIHSWTFDGLVGAFIELTIAYLLLCVSAFVFFASKFLGFLGLSLPCICNEFQMLSIDSQKKIVSSVMVSVKRSFPFNSICQEDYTLNLRLNGDGMKETTAGVVQIEDGASSSQDSIGNCPFTPLAIGSRGDGPESREFSPISSYNLSSTGMGSRWDRSPCIIGKEGSIYGDDDDAINGESESFRILERALEEERAGRIAVYLELEKERTAAATAANETMAMILRLQVEKAEREMEARQYQGMVEEQSAYQEEEITILKEMILSIEKETHLMEKEVQTYRDAFAFSTGYP